MKKLTAVLTAVLALGVIAAPGGLAVASAKPVPKCATFTGVVRMTYTSPDTIIMTVGRHPAPTVFTITPSTVFVRNGLPATFSDIQRGDTGTITAVEDLPSGTLLTCSVTVSGP